MNLWLYRWYALCSHSAQIDVCRELVIGILHNNALRRQKKNLRCTIDREHRKCMEKSLANVWVRVRLATDFKCIPLQHWPQQYYVFKCMRICVRMLATARAISHSPTIPSEWIGFYCDCFWGMFGTAPDDLVLLLLFYNNHHCHTLIICAGLCVRNSERTEFH